MRVEVHLGNGLPTFSIVGLPAPVVRESRERVRAALAHCGLELPAGRITINLAPADLPKEGGRFDLPIAVGILLASGQLQPQFDTDRTEFYGELGLTGELKPVPGLLLAALHAGRVGHALVVPRCTGPEVAAASPAVVRGIQHLGELGNDPMPLLGHGDEPAVARCRGPALDLADVRGQWQAKRALVIAAAGGHGMLMLGPPGSGKTMLALRLPGLLPPLSHAEMLEVAAITAVAAQAGAAGGQSPGLVVQPPFRAPHHTASAHAIVGGGVSIQPGEVSLAHHGVLFLDELPEFDRRVLEALREPLESGRVSVARANQRAEFPAQFLLVAAMNPCPCGRAGQQRPRCRCKPVQVQHYRARISGPLLDRIDLQLELPAVDGAWLLAEQADPAAMGSASARALVCGARERQQRRQGCLNARLDAARTMELCRPDSAGLALLRRASSEQGCSARVQHRMLRVARSIADLEGREKVSGSDVAEALSLRLQE